MFVTSQFLDMLTACSNIQLTGPVRIRAMTTYNQNLTPKTERGSALARACATTSADARREFVEDL